MAGSPLFFCRFTPGFRFFQEGRGAPMNRVEEPKLQNGKCFKRGAFVEMALIEKNFLERLHRQNVPPGSRLRKPEVSGFILCLPLVRCSDVLWTPFGPLGIRVFRPGFGPGREASFLKTGFAPGFSGRGMGRRDSFPQGNAGVGWQEQ